MRLLEWTSLKADDQMLIEMGILASNALISSSIAATTAAVNADSQPFDDDDKRVEIVTPTDQLAAAARSLVLLL